MEIISLDFCLERRVFSLKILPIYILFNSFHLIEKYGDANFALTQLVGWEYVIQNRDQVIQSWNWVAKSNTVLFVPGK